MPSETFYVFKKNIKQVDKLLEAFREMRPPQRGRKHLDHFTRAALLFLCASWEVYIEQISVESCKKIIDAIDSPNELPERVKKTLSDAIKCAKNELEPVSFATDWRAYYLKLTQEYVARLNTPKRNQVVDILHKYIGAEEGDIDNRISMLKQIDDIVKARGEIAHNVFSDRYVQEGTIASYKSTVMNLVKEVETFLWEYLPTVTNAGCPWQKTYHKH